MAYMEDIPSNSKKAKEERKELSPVVQGKVTSRKEGIGKKFAETFLSDDIYDVKHYVLHDVLIPSIRDGIYEVFTGGLSMLFYGNAKGHSKTKSGTYVNYSGYSSGTKKARSTSLSSIERYAYNDIIFESRGDALEVKETMDDILERFNVVSVADFYELAGEDSSFTDQKYGWTNLDGVTVMRDREGYRLRLPKAGLID